MDRDVYRALAGSFPTGVTIVTTKGSDGSPRGLTTQSFVGLSQDPPLMLVSLDKTSRTLAELRTATSFVINFLKVGAEDVATRFASKSEDKFAGISWLPAANGSPILHDAAVAYAECDVHDQVEAGDHVVFIGLVQGGKVIGGAPLMYYHRTYAGWPEEKPAPQMP